MVAIMRAVGLCIVAVCCVSAMAVGVSSITKYRSDRETYDTVAAYRFNGTCNLVGSSIYSADNDCLVLLYDVELRPQASNAFLAGYHAFSNFFQDTCGGVIYGNVTNRNITRQCWYRNVNDTRVRLVPLLAFEADTVYLYMGAALAIIGAVPPFVMLLTCCCVGTVRLTRFVAWRRRVAALGGPAGAVAVVTNPTERDHEPSEDIHIAELSPTAGDWSGRLICKTDFATAAVQRFRTMDRFRTEECPLCFRNFGTCVVWWTCGHFVCDECNPRILVAERRWGHLLHPRCPLCRERSDINDIVKVKLKSDSDAPGSTTSASDPNHAADSVATENAVELVFIDGGVQPQTYSAANSPPLSVSNGS